jgi:uncharacterized protein with von Willebrand factor type A (vWA) domain
MRELRERGEQGQPETGTHSDGLPELPELGGEVEVQGQPAPVKNPAQGELEELQRQAQELVENSISGERLEEALEEAGRRASEVVERVATVERMVGGRMAGKRPGTLTFVRLVDGILYEKVDVTAIELAGRIADSMPRFVKVVKTPDRFGEELGGYRLTKNVERVLPRELALPDDLFYYKLASNGLISKVKLAEREGAFYVLVDKSGSMAEGSKMTWAKAVALALLKLARAKGRRFYLRFFDYEAYQFMDDSDPYNLANTILSVSPDGGTSIDSAIRTALMDLNRGELREQTNTIIIITDGEDTVTVRPEELRRVNATLLAVMIQGHNSTLEGLARATGGKFMKAELSKEGALRVVDATRR